MWRLVIYVSESMRSFTVGPLVTARAAAQNHRFNPTEKLQFNIKQVMFYPSEFHGGKMNRKQFKKTRENLKVCPNLTKVVLEKQHGSARVKISSFLHVIWCKEKLKVKLILSVGLCPKQTVTHTVVDRCQALYRADSQFI